MCRDEVAAEMLRADQLSTDATTEGYILGVNNLKWRDAMAVLGRYFSANEKLAGWTESLTTKQIAVLQRPHKWIGTEQTELCKALVSELVKACRNGELASTMVAMPATTAILRKKESSNPLAHSEYLRGKDGGENLVKAILLSFHAPPTIETYLVTAQDFKNWWKLQGEVPSVHIQAWFDAVIPPNQTVQDVPATTAPAVKPVQRSAAQDAAILAALQSMSIDPLAISKNLPGKPGTKAKVRAALDNNPLFTGTTVFDRAWERLTKRREIVIRT
jgi:hypothetical protein